MQQKTACKQQLWATHDYRKFVQKLIFTHDYRKFVHRERRRWRGRSSFSRFRPAGAAGAGQWRGRSSFSRFRQSRAIGAMEHDCRSRCIGSSRLPPKT